MRSLLALGCLLLVACGGSSEPDDAGPPDAGPPDAGPPDAGPGRRLWQSSDTSCLYASPVAVSIDGETRIFSLGINGEMRLRDPLSGEDVWMGQIETVDPDADLIVALATPALVADRYLILGYADLRASPYAVFGFHVSVFDLTTLEMAPDFERWDVAASVPAHATGFPVQFDRSYAVMRSAIKHVKVPDRELGLAYASFGNGPSVQPFHGWVFELDLDAWRDGSADDAVSGTLLTTQENDCGPRNNRDTMVCGGGVWNAAGPTLWEDAPGDYELFVPTGNGRVDFDVGAYAHAVLRAQRGLEFDPGCDDTLCAPFDELDPSPACLESCENIFVPRLPEGAPPLAPEEGTCEGLTFLECYGALDADLGANAPVVFRVPGGPRVVVQPGKDGALYLVDADHLGRMYQRMQIMDFCGTPEVACQAIWVGMFVTHPAVSEVDGDPVVILASQMTDAIHPSGITAVRVRMQDGVPQMSIHWQVPDVTSEEARTSFRYHPQRPVIVNMDGEPAALVVETRRGIYAELTGIDPPGRLWAVRVRDGEVLFREDLSGAGQRFAIPLVLGDHVYVNSCDGRAQQEGRIDAFQLEIGN